MPSNHSRFQPRSAIYECSSCVKKTRETGQGESSCGVCAYCFLIGSEENALSDGTITQAEFDVIKAALDNQYGRTF
jgi:hypothetical protein